MAKKYLALLRGINVGGKRRMKMADLRASFEKMGFKDVRTYIQTGNVIFSTNDSLKKIEATIKSQLAKDFEYNSNVIVLSDKKLEKIVAEAPKGFGDLLDKYRYDFIFLKSPLTADQALKEVTAKDGVDAVHKGDGVLYFSRLISKASSSHVTRLIKTSIYKKLTIRNWNTTSKLLNMMQET